MCRRFVADPRQAEWRRYRTEVLGEDEVFRGEAWNDVFLPYIADGTADYGMWLSTHLFAENTVKKSTFCFS